MPAKFSLGRTVATPGALDALTDAGETPVFYLDRHITGDWGNVPPEDAQENERELGRHRHYHLREKTSVFIISQPVIFEEV